MALTHPGDREFPFHGYVARHTPTGDWLAQRLGKGKESTPPGVSPSKGVVSTPLIVTLAYPDPSGNTRQVIIHQVLRDQWFLTNGPAANLMPR